MNILVTNVNDGGQDVLVMTEEPMSSFTLACALTQKKQTFDEIYPIKDEERQFYCYDPLWMESETVQNTQRLADAFIAENKGNELYESVKRKCGR